jgi:Na+/proline symporter
VAGLLAATMSSIDSGVNACTAAYVTDFQKRFQWKKLSSKWLSLTIGVVSTTLALILIPAIGKSNSVFAIVNKLVNGLGSPLLCLMLLGMFSKKTNASGVFVGGIIGLFASLAISFWLKPLALQYYAVANLLVCLASCYVCSWIFATRRDAERDAS